MIRRKFNLGIIGLSEGNGHPYSWSAIFNGYDKVQMEKCGFPVIPRYLEKEDFPNVCIKNAKVTHVWTQDKKISKHLSQTVFIENIVDKYTDMIGKVDGVLIARDDANNHITFAMPFLKKGIPVFIDKPLAYSLKEAKKLLALEKYEGQIFSCSAFKYAPELDSLKKNLKEIGDLKLIKGSVPKNWKNYAIHVIDPIIELIPNLGIIRKRCLWEFDERNILILNFDNNLEINIQSFGYLKTPLEIKLFGQKNSISCEFKDTFKSFRNSLNNFLRSIQDENYSIDKKLLLKSIEIVEAGIKYK
tara:strand:+ start:365 stop:1270 length:906 start_codon:yes stop_codon:yes gene_type:complete